MIVIVVIVIIMVNILLSLILSPSPFEFRAATENALSTYPTLVYVRHWQEIPLRNSTTYVHSFYVKNIEYQKNYQ